jgi:hypothetical protein
MFWVGLIASAICIDIGHKKSEMVIRQHKSVLAKSAQRAKFVSLASMLIS